MASILSRDDLTRKDREEIENILKKEISAIDEYDTTVLRARRGYLTPVEVETFKSVLEVKKK